MAANSGPAGPRDSPADPAIRQLRRLLEMQAAARHGMSQAALGDADPAENAFIEEELDRMGEIHGVLAAALDHLEAGGDPGEIAERVASLSRLSASTPWADSRLLDDFIERYGEKE